MIIQLEWLGPFVFVPQPGFECVFHRPECARPGVYLWTVEHQYGYLVNYVGETGRDLRSRLEENVQWSYCGKEGRAAEPEQFRHGISKITSFDFSEFLADYSKWSSWIHDNYRSYRVFIAPIELDAEVRKCVEAGIIRTLRAAGGNIADFLANKSGGKRYLSSLSVQFLTNHAIHGLGRVIEC